MWHPRHGKSEWCRWWRKGEWGANWDGNHRPNLLPLHRPNLLPLHRPNLLSSLCASCSLSPPYATDGSPLLALQEAANAFRALLTDLEGLLLPECSLAVTDSISLADCAYPALFLYADLILPILGRYDVLDWKALPRLRRWREALWTQPAVVAMLVRLRPAAEEWMERQLHS